MGLGTGILNKRYKRFLVSCVTAFSLVFMPFTAKEGRADYCIISAASCAAYDASAPPKSYFVNGKFHIDCNGDPVAFKDLRTGNSNCHQTIDWNAQPYDVSTCEDHGIGGQIGLNLDVWYCDAPEMSDYLAMMFVLAAGGMIIYRVKSRNRLAA